MAKDKKSFLLYCDQIHLFEGLDDAEAGRLIKHIFNYVNDKNPEPIDKITKIAFEPIKHQLKRDLVKYEALKNKNSLNARKRWDAVASNGMPNDAKHADTVTDTVNVTVTDNVKESVIQNQLTQWFKDLPNSMDLEDIARMTQSTKELLSPRVEEFKKYCEPSYPTYNKFLFHFKRWLLKNPPQQVKKSKALLG